MQVVERHSRRCGRAARQRRLSGGTEPHPECRNLLEARAGGLTAVTQAAMVANGAGKRVGGATLEQLRQRRHCTPLVSSKLPLHDGCAPNQGHVLMRSDQSTRSVVADELDDGSPSGAVPLTHTNQRQAAARKVANILLLCPLIRPIDFSDAMLESEATFMASMQGLGTAQLLVPLMCLPVVVYTFGL
jgi:hypothetical protein